MLSNKYAEYVGEFYKLNKTKFEMPTDDYSIDFKQIKNLETNKCAEASNYVEFIKEFYKHVQYIGFPEIQKIYDLHVKELIEYSKKFELVLVTTKRIAEKSNFWLSMYIYGKLLENGIKINYIFGSMDDLIGPPESTSEE